MQISLETFMNGAVNERVGEELKKVVENMMDPNTDEKQRKLIIEFKLKPDENRKTCSMEFVVKSKLRPAEAMGTTVMIGKTENGYDAAEIGNEVPGQLGIDTKTGKIKENGRIKEDKKVRVIGE